MILINVPDPSPVRSNSQIDYQRRGELSSSGHPLSDTRAIELQSASTTICSNRQSLAITLQSKRKPTSFGNAIIALWW